MIIMIRGTMAPWVLVTAVTMEDLGIIGILSIAARSFHRILIIMAAALTDRTEPIMADIIAVTAEVMPM